MVGDEGEGDEKHEMRQRIVCDGGKKGQRVVVVGDAEMVGEGAGGRRERWWLVMREARAKRGRGWEVKMHGKWEKHEKGRRIVVGDTGDAREGAEVVVGR